MSVLYFRLFYPAVVSDATDNIRFQQGTLVFNGCNFIKDTNQNIPPLPFKDSKLGRTQILDTHPRSVGRWLSASVVAQKRAGYFWRRSGLTRRDRQTGQVKKQQILKIEPNRIINTTRLGAKPAGSTAQGHHQWRQFIDAAADRLGRGDS